MNTGRILGLSAIAGVLAALGHAPFALWPVAVLGFAGLSFCIGFADTRARGAWRAWVAGTAYFAVTLSWIVEPFLVDIARHGWMAPFALVLMAGGLALFWGLAGWLAAGSAWLWPLALASAEIVRGHIFTGFPWGLPAYIWAETDAIMVASLVGPYGLSAITLLLCALPYAVQVRRLGTLMALVGIGALLFVPIGAAEEGGSLGTVRLVQPNAPQHEKWDPDKAHIFVERQIAFAGEPKEDVDLVVLPETAIPYRLRNAERTLAALSVAAEGVPVVTGINRSAGPRNHNALVMVDQGQIAEIYDKVHLVPFGEYIPLGQLAALVGLRSFAAQDGYGFSPGDGVRLIETALGRALPLICYEAIFPGHGRGVARPDYLLQITNDAWFGTFSGPFQHLDQARFRAVEQGLPLVRVANTGVSAVIDARGRVVQSLALGEAGYLDVAVPEGRGATLYARTGDIPAVIFLFVTLGALTVARRRNTIAKADRTD